jgi:hypothetical protein
MSENWLDGICTYTGPGTDLPIGGYSKIPGWSPEKIAKSWIVIDAESEEGITEKKTHELAKEDIIIGVMLNPKTLGAIVKTYGKDFYKIKEADGIEFMTLDEWQERYGSNGLGLVAIRNMQRKLSGAGVRF